VRSLLGHGCAPTSTARAHSSPVGALNAVEGGAGVDLGNIPLEPTKPPPIYGGVHPTLHTQHYTQDK
jgi:hypothetical protein